MICYFAEPQCTSPPRSQALVLCRVTEIDVYLHRSRSNQARQNVRVFSKWSEEYVFLLRHLIKSLSPVVGEGDKFRQKDMQYFLDDIESTTRSPLTSSIIAIDTAIWDLKVILERLKVLENELCKDNPQGVSHLTATKLERHVREMRRLIKTAQSTDDYRK